MGYGIEVYNDSGVPQTIDLSHNLVLLAQGTVSIGSNTAATGSEATVTLSTVATPYLVFIRCSGNACVLRSTTAGFTWFMAQGTTSFEYWAYGRGTASGNAGMQVYNADGSLRWDVGQRPLTPSSLQQPGGTPPYAGEVSTGNILAGSTFTIPSGHAVLYSDPGLMLDVYAPFPGAPTTRGNMRYWPCVSVSGTTLTMNYGRRFANRPSLPSGVSWQTFVTNHPSWIVTAPPV